MPLSTTTHNTLVRFAVIATLTLSSAHTAAPGTSTPGGQLAIPDHSSVADGYDNMFAVKQRLSQLPLHIVEGLWRFPADGGVMAVERCNLGGNASDASQYRMVIVNSANRALRPGTVMGYLWATSRRGVYEASMFTSSDNPGTTLTSPKKFILSLDDDDSRLTFKPIRRGLKLNLWRMLPYIFRFSVRKYDNTPDDLNGCVRLYPPPALPAEPRYL